MLNCALPPTLQWCDDALHILDQTRLPATETVLRIDTLDAAIEAIQALRVRGAPAIGIAAAYALCAVMRDRQQLPPAAFRSAALEASAALAAARPTAVNLCWALDRLCRTLDQRHASAAQWQLLLGTATEMHTEDRDLCDAIGAAAVDLIQPGMTVLTHCNAGALATTGIGTATAPIYLAHRRGIPFRVLACETRPLLQGARLTAWELQRAGIEVEVIVDAAAAGLMAAGAVDLVVVGADRVAANGDVVNKVGTLSHAVAANHFGIPFYVAFPYSTIDRGCVDGRAIPIEQRASSEVLQACGQPIAAAHTRARNPAFDLTPAALVTALITDRGMIPRPFAHGIAAALSARD